MRSDNVTFFHFFLLLPLALCYDEVSDFCSRWAHRSVVKNNRLYIDGGNEVFKSATSSGKPYVQGINQKLIEVDMTSSWDWKSNISIVGITKTTNPNTGTLPPSLISGGMYGGTASDNNIYMFGGTWSQLNSSFANTYPDPSTYSLWSFDTSGQTWNQYDVSGAVPQRPSRGGYTEAPDQGLAFYFNGDIDKGSSVTTTNLGNKTLGLQGMIMLNMTAEAGPSARNLSTAISGSGTAAASSELIYVPQIGANGILVEMGGTIISSSTAQTQNGTLATFDSVNVFDIDSAYTGNGNWYKQTTSGNVPAARIDTCTVVVPAPDNSSYNIYMYGGWDPTLGGKMYDDMYILSLPSFTWTQIYSGDSPRFGHTCHLVGKRQLLTVGGLLTTNATSSCDWETKSVAIMDLSTKVWGSVFNAFAAPYQVTSDLLTVIGGTASGGATMKSPQGGFTDPSLQAVFSAHRATATTGASTGTPSPSGAVTSSGAQPSKKKTSAGAIAGGIVAALAGVAIIAGLVIFFLRRKRQQAIRLPTNTQDLPPSYEKDTDGYYEMMAKGNHAELAGGKDTHELPAIVPIYELSGGDSRVSSRQHERAELESRDMADDASTANLKRSRGGE